MINNVRKHGPKLNYKRFTLELKDTIGRFSKYIKVIRQVPFIVILEQIRYQLPIPNLFIGTHTN